MDVPKKGDAGTQSSLAASITPVADGDIFMITPAPVLIPDLRRDAYPEPAPQAATTDIQQLSQSAVQAIQQASDSVRQASQSASQAAQQASQSASNAIAQAQNSASQSISQASRSIASAQSLAASASSVASLARSSLSSIQQSAQQAISSANAIASSAQLSASSAQSQASKAVLQAGAAVAAATGSAAAAGSSFLQAASQATQSAGASVSAIAAAAGAQVSQASIQVQQSQVTAVTATQAAIAIVGSIIASALITILIYFLISRHRRKAQERQQKEQKSSEQRSYPQDTKYPVSDQVASITRTDSSSSTVGQNDNLNSSETPFSLFPKTAAGENPFADKPRDSIKTTSLAWNPSNPPRAPTLSSWLKVQDGISPFGPINLPMDNKPKAPLGGQLKSPLQSVRRPPSPKVIAAPTRSPTIPVLQEQPVPTASAKQGPPIRKPVNPFEDYPPVQPSATTYRESIDSNWTDEVPNSGSSPPLQSPPAELKKAPASVTKGYEMDFPIPKGQPVRNTAEWLAEQQQRDSQLPQNQRVSQLQGKSGPRGPGGSGWQPRSSTMSSTPGGLPRNSKKGLPSNPGANRNTRGDSSTSIGYVQGLNRFVAERGSIISRSVSQSGSERSLSIDTPGVGRAM